MNDTQMRKANFLAAVALLLFSAAAVIAALAMPRYSQGWYAAPGFPPLAFGIVLGMMSLALLVRTIVQGGWQFRLSTEHLRRVRDSKAVRRISVMGAFIASFLVLFGRIPFLLLSFAFLFGTIWYYKGAKLWQNAIISAVSAFIIWYVFGVLFMVPLH
jgi:putative tricarboxylic transport membrane protein